MLSFILTEFQVCPVPVGPLAVQRHPQRYAVAAKKRPLVEARVLEWVYTVQ